MALKALFSINEIHMTVEPGVAATRDTTAVPPKEVIVKTGTAFYAKDEADQEFFLKNGAAREATEAEARDLEPPKAKKAKAEAKAEAKTEAKTEAKKADDTQTGGAGDGANLV